MSAAPDLPVPEGLRPETPARGASKREPAAARLCRAVRAAACPSPEPRALHPELRLGSPPQPPATCCRSRCPPEWRLRNRHVTALGDKHRHRHSSAGAKQKGS